MTSTQRHPVLQASLWMMVTLSCFTLMAISIRELSDALNPFQILFFRSAIGLPIILAVLYHYGSWQARTKRPLLHIARNGCHFIGQFGWVYAIAFIPLAQVFALEFTTPLWTAILASLVLGEKIDRYRLLAVGTGLAGVLIILRPDQQVVHPAAFAVLIAALGYALTNIFTKQLAATDTPLTIVFYMLVVQLPLGLIPVLFDWKMPQGIDWLWLTIVAITALVAHYSISKALALADASVVIPIDFLRLPLIGVLGFLLYDEAIDLFVIGGALLMLGGNLVNINAERKRESRAS